MNCSWDDLIERIEGLDRIDAKYKARFASSLNILRKKLGTDLPDKSDHPLLGHLQTIYGNPFDELVLALSDDMVILEKVTGIDDIIERIGDSDKYFAAVAELEVGGLLAKNGYELMIEPKVGGKRPDFHCKKNGLEFLVEVKTLQESEAHKQAAKTSQQIIAACAPIFPAGIIHKSLAEPILNKAASTLREMVGRVNPGLPQEVDISGILKLYLVHPDDPCSAEKYDQWCCKQETLKIIPNCGGLAGPPEDLSDLSRIRRKIYCFSKEKQIPNDKQGVLFVTGRFIIGDNDVERIVNELVRVMNEFAHIPAVVLIAAKTATVSPVESRIHEDDRYIDIDYRLAPFLRERVLIIKNSFCRFPFDYDILQQMFAEPNSKTPDFELKRS